jgi:putative nucleotidyltransferase with HDIG domain
MYLSKHQGGNSVSSAEQGDPKDRKRWKKDVLEAYLGVTLKRLFSTGPEAFEEIYRRLEQFTRSLGDGSGSSSENLPPAVVETVTSLAFAIDAKDRYTQGHSKKVAAYAVMIAQALGMTQKEVEEIRLAALLHDIGKVGIPEPILNKSGPLDASEWETMKTHTDLGSKILEPLKPMIRIRQMVRHHVGKVGIPEQILNKSGPLNPDEWETMKTHVTYGGKLLEPLLPLTRIRQMVLHHHEFFDGTGYPDRLEGEQIPQGARVIAIADAYDTITSERTYKKARTPEDAFTELERCSANQFDPVIVRIFIDAMRRVPNHKFEAGVTSSDGHDAPLQSTC